MFDSPIISMVIQSLLRCFPDEVPYEDRWGAIFHFFGSSYFSEVPLHRISTRIYATLKDMVKQGAYANRNKAIQRLGGFFQDVKHVSTYAPYCDAFVLDQAMASIVTDPRVDLENRYGVKVFSLNNWDQFLAWLQSLEADMDQNHRAGIESAYPIINSSQFNQVNTPA